MGTKPAASLSKAVRAVLGVEALAEPKPKADKAPADKAKTDKAPADSGTTPKSRTRKSAASRKAEQAAADLAKTGESVIDKDPETGLPRSSRRPGQGGRRGGRAARQERGGGPVSRPGNDPVTLAIGQAVQRYVLGGLDLPALPEGVTVRRTRSASWIPGSSSRWLAGACGTSSSGCPSSPPG